MNKLLAAIAAVILILTVYKWDLSGFEIAVLILIYILIIMVARIPIPAKPAPGWLRRPTLGDNSPWAKTKRAFYDAADPPTKK